MYAPTAVTLPSAFTGRWILLTEAPPNAPTFLTSAPIDANHSIASAEFSARALTSSGLFLPLPPIIVSNSINSTESK